MSENFFERFQTQKGETSQTHESQFVVLTLIKAIASRPNFPLPFVTVGVIMLTILNVLLLECQQSFLDHSSL